MRLRWCRRPKAVRDVKGGGEFEAQDVNLERSPPSPPSLPRPGRRFALELLRR